MRRRVLIVCAGAATVCYAATQPAIIVTCVVLISIGTTLELNTSAHTKHHGREDFEALAGSGE